MDSQLAELILTLSTIRESITEIRNKISDISPMESTITLTFGECAENHVKMQKIGKIAQKGFSIEELKSTCRKFRRKGYICKHIILNEYLDYYQNDDNTAYASILIVRNGVEALLNNVGRNADDLFCEQSSLTPDTKAKMYGRVVNKKARYNLCFSETSQEPDYNNGKGRIIAFTDVPLTQSIRECLPLFVGDKATNLKVEGNYYYNISKCGIGFHGDTERKRVIGVRLGASLPLHYQWFYKSKPVGRRVELMINHGDIYVMSEKATGFDWKTKNAYTIRHAAGCEKFLTIK